MIEYTLEEFKRDAAALAASINTELAEVFAPVKAIYGIPQGGIPLAIELSWRLGLPLIDRVALEEDFGVDEVMIVDDLADSGATLDRFPLYKSVALFCKTHTPKESRPTLYLREVADWVVFWWERSQEGSIEDNVTRILEYIGEDPHRPGLIDTPRRVVRSWGEMFCGYEADPAEVFKVFEEDGYNELVWMKNIEFYSMCEHHLLPFFGKAHVAYIANDEKVIGASKLARLVDIFSRRATTQERIAKLVTETLMNHLKPIGAACIIEGVHLCMRCRGVEKQTSEMGTSCLRGRFLEDSHAGRAARAELIGLLK